jgi:hypothetical protein
MLAIMPAVMLILPARKVVREAPAASTRASPPQPALKTTDHTKIEAEGKVSDVSCTGVELLLRIEARNGKFRLHARDYTRVDISEDVPFQAGEFQPCAELNGKTALITFVTVERKKYDGEIQAIEVEK